MEFHISLPTWGGVRTSFEDVINVAQAADELGFGGAWAVDHVLLPSSHQARDGTSYTAVFEPLTTLACLASLTDRLLLGAGVIVAALRNPFVLAKEAATLHEMTNGRFVLGIGAGWVQREFENVGVDFGTRDDRTDESIALMRHLLSGDRRPFNGRFYGFENGVFDPIPRDPGPQIIVGGVSRRAIRRARSLGDGWQAVGLEPETFAQTLAVVRTSATGDFPCGVRIQLDSDPDLWLSDIRAWDAAGADYLVLAFTGRPAVVVKQMEAFAGAFLSDPAARYSRPAPRSLG